METYTHTASCRFVPFSSGTPALKTRQRHIGRGSHAWVKIKNNMPSSTDRYA